jgi:hypothetical protein
MSRIGTRSSLLTPDADASAKILTNALKSRDPFWFIKLGDAAVECVYGYGKGTCDGELYTAGLAEQLMSAWVCLRDDCRRLYVGDWRTASFSGPDDKSRYAEEYAALTLHRGHRGAMLHFECLLLMRDTPELLGFYRAVHDDPRRKLLMGPSAWHECADLLRCEFLALPIMPNLIDIAPWIASELERRDFDVMLYGAGMAGHVAVIDCWRTHPGRTYINLGSALDPATVRGRTRRQQMGCVDARAFLGRLTTQQFVTTAGRGAALLKAYDAENAHLMERDLI